MKKLIAGSVLLAVSTFVVPASAGIVIDDFTVVGPKISVLGNGTNSAVVSGAAANIFGTTRSVRVDVTGLGDDSTAETYAQVQNSGPLTSGAVPIPGVGVYELTTSSPPSAISKFTIQWDGGNNATAFETIAVGNRGNFTGLAGFQFWAFSDGVTTGLGQFGKVEVDVKDGAGNIASYVFDAEPTVFLNESDQGHALVFLPFAAFTNFASVNWTDIAGIQAIVNVTSNVRSLDFALRTVTATDIPEPGALALAGLALFGLRVVSQRKSRS